MPPRRLILLALLSALSSAVHCQDPRLAQLGYPVGWRGDQIKQAYCPASGIPPELDGYFFCQLSAAYGASTNRPGEKLVNMIDAIGAVASFRVSQGKVFFSGAYYPDRSFKIWDYYDRDFTKSKVTQVTMFSPLNVTMKRLWDAVPMYPDVLPYPPNVDFWKVGTQVLGGSEHPQLLAKFNMTHLHSFQAFPFVEASAEFADPSAGYAHISMPIHERLEGDGRLWASSLAINTRNGRFSQLVWTVDSRGVRTVEGQFEFPAWNPNDCSRDLQYTGQKLFLPSYMHSITSTENYVILPLTSRLVNPCKLTPEPIIPPDTTIWNPDSLHFAFEEDVPLRFLVFDKRLKQFVTQRPLQAVPAMFVTHQFNAFENEDGTLVADMIAYDSDTAYSVNLDRSYGHVPFEARLLRFTLDLTRSRVMYNYLVPEETMDVEFPQFNHAYEGRRYHWGYVVSKGYSHPSEILKLNMNDATGRRNARYTPDAPLSMGEPYFVASANPRAEDDGVLFVRAVDLSISKGVLLVIDARSMREIGRAIAPISVPFGFHNRFYSNEQLGLPPTLTPITPGWPTLEPPDIFTFPPLTQPPPRTFPPLTRPPPPRTSRPVTPPRRTFPPLTQPPPPPVTQRPPTFPPPVDGQRTTPSPGINAVYKETIKALCLWFPDAFQNLENFCPADDAAGSLRQDAPLADTDDEGRYFTYFVEAAVTSTDTPTN